MQNGRDQHNNGASGNNPLFNLSRDTLLDIIRHNPYSMALFDSDGQFIYGNAAYKKMFPIQPPPEYSIFEDRLLEIHGYSEMVLGLKSGNRIHIPAMHYNPRDINPEFPDIPVVMGIVAFPIMDDSGNLENVVTMYEDVTKSEKAIESLRNSEETFRVFSENSIYGYGELDLDANITSVNENVCFITGYSSEEMIGMNIAELFAEDDLKQARSELEEILEKSFKESSEYAIRKKDGAVSFIEVNTQAQHRDGHPFGYQFVCIDITGRKNREEEIQKLNQFLSVVIESANVWLDVLDENANVLIWNKAAEEISGYSKEEVVGHGKIWEWLYPDEEYRSEIAGKVSEIICSDSRVEDFETEIVDKSGEKKTISWNSRNIVDGEGNSIGSVAMGRDVTERKRTDDLVRRSEEEFRIAFEDAKDAIFWADPVTGILINCNKSAEKMLEMPREEILGLHHSRLHPDIEEDRYRRIFNEHVDESLAAGGATRDGDVEAEVVSKSGKRIPVLISSSVTTIGDLQITQGIFRDITALKKAEEEREQLREQLLQSQKMEAIGTLAGGMAHDFNNSLAVIMGNIEIALNRMPVEEDQRVRLGKALLAARRAKDLTTKLLTFSRKDILNIVSISPNAIVIDLMDILQRSISKKLEIVTDLAEGVPQIMVDANQILQALMNICINSGDSMPGGGRITISTETAKFESERSIGATALSPGRYSVIQVSDTGFGIPTGDIPKIFDPFFTTKERGKGTGLGLSITIEVIVKHGGAIEVHSTPGEGTTVRIYLPAGTGEPHELIEEAASDFRSSASTILVVDDDRDYVDMVVEALTIYGYNPLPARTGEAAIEMFKRLKEEIDLVLLDMLMPGMDGTEVFGKLKEIDPDKKIMVCSGYSRSGDVEKLLEAGAASFIQKPFATRELADAIEKVL